ncbi:MAG: glutathione peroxidase, partial [Plesiomonas shigelloides]
MSEIYDFPLTLLDGTPFDTQSLRGQVVLVVNVASRCGFTPQYAELEKLYRELEAQGFVILAFPCNQFGAQEPGSAEEIARFCSLT